MFVDVPCHEHGSGVRVRVRPRHYDVTTPTGVTSVLRRFPRLRMRGVCSSIMLGGAKAPAIAAIGWSIVGCGGGGEILGSIGSTVRDASSETFADGPVGSPDGAIESDKDGDEQT